MVYGRYNYSIHGVYRPTYNWGAPSCTIAEIFAARPQDHMWDDKKM